MASLKTKHQVFVVTRLARFDKPSEVRDALREQFGVEAGLDQIVYYNPETANGGQGLAEKWKELFYETRERYLEDTSTIPAAHKAFRIRELAEAAEEAKDMRNYPLMASMYEQIAKEMGGKYTNKQEHSGPGGGAIPFEWVNGSDAPDE